MKKLLIALAFAGISTASMAQENETVPTEKYSVATNSFWSNWFVQANVAGSAFYCNEEVGLNLSKSPFKGFRNNLGFSVAVGKWFTPGLGLRTKFNGVWGRTVVGEDKKENANKYWTLNEQVLFNLSNMLCGYSETRVWNFIPYIGGGVARNMSADTYAMGLGAGILNTFRLTDKLAANLEVGYGIYEPDFSGIAEGGSTRGGINKLKNKDHQFTVEVGLTYNLGKAKWNKTPDVDAIHALSQGQIDALNAQLADSQDENAKLKNMLNEANKKAAATQQGQTVKEVVAAPVSVFFNIGKSNIASRKDLQNVKALVEVAKANNSKLVVTGYADSKTGSAAFNQKLSEKRANTVANELVKMGVNRDNIEVVGAGGVNVLSPVSYNRRATVTLK
ncbi:MAG: OmpA family protein [Prevotella sp.]|nr:OmpA family protein [Prevotella sp.]